MSNPILPSHPLPPDYYLDYFMQVIEGFRARYDFLLTAAERRHLAKLEALSEPARMLYARLVNRRGPCFRIQRLAYPEIGSLDRPVRELATAQLLDPSHEISDPARQMRVFACFTHAELKGELRRHAVPKHRRKDDLLAWLAEWDGCTKWLTELLAEDPVIAIPRADPWPFLRFLFFGEMRNNLADFVTRELGLVVTEIIDAVQLTRCFATRREAEDAYRMAARYAEFRRIRASQAAVQTLAWWRAENVDRAALSAGISSFDRVVDRLGHLLEREKQTEAALELYKTSPVAPARERRARLLIKSGRSDEAATLLREVIDVPCHAEELYAVRQLLARLERTSRRSEARHYQLSSHSIELDYPDGGVEAAVLAHYRAKGWCGVHSENWLWNACFGLLLWDIIYDPSVGAFHSPLQVGPSDLHSPAFYGRREGLIEARLVMLAEPEVALSCVKQNFLAKSDIANPFVCWHQDLPDLLDIMLHRLPPQGLAAAFRRLAQDVRRHSRGFPDLFLWTGDDYRFVEIKTENDQLSGHQYEWLRFLAEADIHVSLEKTKRPVRTELAGQCKN